MNKELLLRLTKYKRLLHKLKALGLERVFSNNLGDAIGVAPALVRKDFSNLNLPGNKRGGYNIDDLIHRLDKVLGRDLPQRIIIAGCGKIGTALMKFEEFSREGISIVAGFDIMADHMENTSEIPIYHIDKMADFIREQEIQVGIIAVPDTAASAVFETMIKAGIKGILNFAAVELKCNASDPQDCATRCTIHNVNIGLEIEHIFYQVNLKHPGSGCFEDEAV
ncbi:MAG: redox-sensing transcriptional repressor Rex [Spirochaetales bacterium]|nr:redox-sensing transcriptional repressor Rex [Spirochaetales bacterium]